MLYGMIQNGGGKSSDANFDGLLACIAHTDTENFDSTFEYVPVTLHSTGNTSICKNSFLPSEALQDTLTFGVQPCGPAFSRRDFVAYASARHLFILGPLSKEAFDRVDRIITCATRLHPVIIHFQGEHKVMGDENEASFWKMTPPIHTFPNSFNWFAGMKYGVQLRTRLSKLAKSYVVRVKTKVRSGSIPKIYMKMSEYIHDLVYTKGNNDRRIGPILKTALVVQDMYDKDNVCALTVIASHSAKNSSIPLCLVGRECFRVADATTHSTAEDDTRSEIRRDLDFDAKSDRYWPRFASTSRYTCVPDPTRTLFENRVAATFMLYMLEDLQVRDRYVVSPLRNQDTISVAGKCKFDVAPFNEAIFVPTLAYVVNRFHMAIERSLVKFSGDNTIIWFCRHGETEGNRTKTFQRASMPLSNRGMRQAVLLGERVAAMAHTLKGSVAIISSTLTRTMETSRKVVDVLKRDGVSFVMQTTSALQERNFGDLRGTKYRSFPDFHKLLENKYIPPGDGGESKAQFEVRVSHALSEVRAFSVRAKERGCRFVVVVSHGLMLNAILSKHCDVPSVYRSEMLNGLKNTSVSMCLWDHKLAPQLYLPDSVNHLEGSGVEAIDFAKKKSFVGNFVAHTANL